MKRKFLLLSVIFIVLSITNCTDTEYPILKTFPIIPVNLEGINTSYDEYDGTIAGFYYDDISFILSSNSKSEGDHFDILNYFISYQYSTIDNSSSFFVNNSGYVYFDSVLVNINTTANEYGTYIAYDTEYNSDVFFYITELSGNSDIYYSVGDFYNTNWSNPQSLDKLNTDFNETSITMLNNEILFCSDFDGNYDIYKVDISPEINVKDWLDSDATPQKTGFDILNSQYDEKCPHVNGNYILFSSNRDGGFGGYDLYYSHYINGQWSEPVNFGENINTEFDELNPIAVHYWDAENDLMFFSSNRSGGKGGFDIYYVGIQKLTK